MDRGRRGRADGAVLPRPHGAPGWPPGGSTTTGSSRTASPTSSHRIPVVRRDSEYTLDLVLTHCATRAQQDAAVAALSFKCDVLRAMLDAIEYHAAGRDRRGRAGDRAARRGPAGARPGPGPGRPALPGGRAAAQRDRRAEVVGRCDGRSAMPRSPPAWPPSSTASPIGDVAELLADLAHRRLLSAWTAPGGRPARLQRPPARAGAAGPGRRSGLLAELTYRCPLHCTYCANPREAGRLPRRAGHAAPGCGCSTRPASSGVLQVHLSGGEPLLRPDLADAGRPRPRDLGMYTNLVTSGIPLDAEPAWPSWPRPGSTTSSCPFRTPTGRADADRRAARPTTASCWWPARSARGACR